jgi:hypothetical protein
MFGFAALSTGLAVSTGRGLVPLRRLLSEPVPRGLKPLGPALVPARFVPSPLR